MKQTNVPSEFAPTSDELSSHICTPRAGRREHLYAAMAATSVVLFLLGFLVMVAAAASQVSDSPVTIRGALRGSLSPIDGSPTATRFARALTRGAIFPATTAAFCRDAGLMCEDDVSIAPYASSIKTINDFQFDFFLEADLTPGAKMRLAENLHDPIPKRAFLPKEVAETLPPLTTPNLPKLTQTFNIGADSKMAAIMHTAASLCESPPLPGEARACPTSVEAMAAFVASQLGTHDITLLASSGAPDAAPADPRPVTVTDFTTGSPEEGKKIVICHNLMFPSQLYYCHHVTGTKVVRASLAAADGSVIRGVAICHLDTTMWASEHPAFAALHIPRGAEACHWTVQNDMVWVRSSHQMMP